VAGRKLVTTYQIYNVGTSPAYNVKLTDDSWPEENFEKILGLTSVSLEKLAPGTNFTHTIVLRPKVPGRIFLDRGIVSYQQTPKGSPQQCWTTDVGEIEVVLRSESERRTAPHLGEWTIFGILALISIAPAALYWFYIYINYAYGIRIKRKSKKK